MKLYLGVTICSLLVVPLVLIDLDYSWIKTFLGVLLLMLCLYPCARYYSRGDRGLPTMPVFCLAYAVQFAFPIFTNDDTIRLMGGEISYLDHTDVVAALVLATLGIVSLQLGYYWFQKSRYRTVVPVAHLPLQKSRALVYCVAVGVCLPLIITFKGIIPEEFQQPLSSTLRLLQTQVLVVIGVLGWLYYRRSGSVFYAVWLYGLVCVTALQGVSSGSLEKALVPFGVLFVVKWLYLRRVPVIPIVTTALIVVFLSPVKSQYRLKYWFGEDQQLSAESSLTRGITWVTDAAEYWGETLTGDRNLTEATSSATGRADFIHQVAHIYSMTPDVVAYQYGRTYSFFVVAFIPRVIWPDKPTAGSANAFYAVSYGVTSEEAAKITTFGVSIVGEAFINFGIYGVVFIMLLFGVLISILHHSFGVAEAGPGGQAVFLAFFVFFLNGIGSSAEIMFGGILQNLVCGYFLLLWAKDRPAKKAEREVLSLRGLAANLQR